MVGHDGVGGFAAGSRRTDREERIQATGDPDRSRLRRRSHDPFPKAPSLSWLSALPSGWGSVAFSGNVMRGFASYGAMLAGYSAAMVALIDTAHPENVWHLGCGPPFDRRIRRSRGTRGRLAVCQQGSRRQHRSSSPQDDGAHPAGYRGPPWWCAFGSHRETGDPDGDGFARNNAGPTGSRLD